MSDFEKTCGYCGRVFRNEADFLTYTTRWRLCKEKNLWFNCMCGSTLVLLQGKFPWYDPKRHLSKEGATVFDRLAAREELPYFPTSIMEVQRLLAENEPNPHLLAKAMRNDPILAAEILGIANNLKTSTGQKIASIEHAIVYVGTKTVSEIVLTAAVKMLTFKTSKFISGDFWKTAFLTGNIAEVIAFHRKAKNPDEAYLAGTLSSIGKVVEAICYPKEADQIYQLTISKTNPMSWETAEKRLGTIDHCIIGEVAATLWGLPLYVVDAARHHHAAPLIGSGATELSISEIVAFAVLIKRYLNNETWAMDDFAMKAFSYRCFSKNSEFTKFLDNVKEKHFKN